MGKADIQIMGGRKGPDWTTETIQSLDSKLMFYLVQNNFGNQFYIVPLARTSRALLMNDRTISDSNNLISVNGYFFIHLTFNLYWFYREIP